MSIILTDTLTIDAAPKRSPEGYLAVRAKAARTGIYDYLGREVDPTGKHFKPDQIVKVFRDEAEVFSQDAVKSFLMKPVTDDHPSTPVTSQNHKDLARGAIASAVRDGEHLAFDLVFWDAETIRKIESGDKRELSNGYATDLDFTAGTTPDGQAYDARQTNIRGNHVALVKAGRAGSTCAIGTCDAIPLNTILVNGDTKTMKTITIDGNSVEVSDAAEIAVKNLMAKLTATEAKLADAEKSKEDEDKEAAEKLKAKDAEIAALKSDLADARDPAKIDAAVKDRAAVTDKAKAMLGDKLTIDGKSVHEIRKQVVDAKLGDAAKDYDEAMVKVAFDTLTVSAKADPLARALSDAKPNITDAKALEDEAFSKRAARFDRSKKVA